MKAYNHTFKIIFFVLLVFILMLIAGVFMLIYLSSHQFISPDDQMAMRILGVAFFFSILILILVGILVFKDASRIGMNPWMWLTIVVFVPNALGIIIYLVVRSSEKKKMSCGNCGKLIQKNYSLCPYCGTDFKNNCPKCNKPVNSDWIACPYCKHKLTV